jgi:hypothetical protein
MATHTIRNYFPTDEPSQLIWAGNHITALEQIGTSLFGIPAATITALRADYTHITQLYAWRDHTVELGRDYNSAKDRALWDAGGPDITLHPVNPASLGDKQITIPAGFYRRLFANADIIECNPKCTDEVRRQLYILPPCAPRPTSSPSRLA